MGANEKCAATYHGGQYTPTTENVEHSYVAYQSSKVDLITGHHEFTRWLETVRAEAKREALTDMAHVLEADIPGHAHENGQIIAGRNIIRIIRARANQYKEAPNA